jgi:hypothetical protein
MSVGTGVYTIILPALGRIVNAGNGRRIPCQPEKPKKSDFLQQKEEKMTNSTCKKAQNPANQP